MAIDLAVLAPLSNLGNIFLLLAGGSALLLWIRRPGAWQSDAADDGQEAAAASAALGAA